VFRRRDEELRRVYREHVDAVYAFFGYSVPRTAAEDLTSSTFERVIRSWRSYDPRRSSERTWILSIARNLLWDHFRRESHRTALSTDEHPELVEALAGVDGSYGRILSDDALLAWLAPLDEREREVVVLRYALELSGAEVAEVMGLSTANVHQIASRALRRLRQLAKEHGVRDSL
jgi:RNA polymerase sigma-70 factor (ECF subfamily)